jgi:hypothetical protein
MKGVSPVLEGVIAIAITLSISLLVGNFLTSSSRSSMDVVGNQTEQKVAAVYTSFYISNTTFDAGFDCTEGVNHTINVTLRNTGQKTIDISSIVFESVAGDVVSFPFARTMKPGEFARFSFTGEDECASFIFQNQSGSGYANGIRKIYAVSGSHPYPNSMDGDYMYCLNCNQTESRPGRYTMGLWHFNSSLADSTSYGNNGSYGPSGSPVYDSGVSAAFGNSIEFDGASGYVEVNNSQSLSGMDQITIEAWYYNP